MRGTRVQTHLTIQAVEPSGTIISLEVDESDLRELVQGFVPEHVATQCEKALERLDACPEME